MLPVQLKFFNNPKQPMQSKFERLSGSVQPQGWIVNMMECDLGGIVGALGELYPGVKSGDLYNPA